MKKGFTLIELIGVVILLSLIALISFPIILSTIKNTKAELSEANKTVIFSGASSYVTKYQNSFKKTTGNVYCITIKDLIINNMVPNTIQDKNISLSTYVKVDVTEEEYQYSLAETCEPQMYLPDIVLSVVGSPFNENGWANDNFYISIVGTGHSYKYCISDGTCTPNTLVNNSSGTAYVTTNSTTNYVCAQAIGIDADSRVVCTDPYKLDKQAPIIAPKVPYYVVVTPNTNIASIDYFNYENNGGSEITNTACDISNTSALALGEHTLTCTTTKENGKSSTATKTIDVSNCFDFTSDTGTIVKYNCYSGNTGGYFVKSDAVIPYSINNVDVQEIAPYYNGSFHQKQLTSIDFSNAIQLKTIDSGAFSNNKLATLDLSPLINLEAIYGYVFDDNQLTTVNFSNLSNLNYIGYQSFRNNQLTSIDLNDMISLSSITSELFQNNALTSVDIPNNIKEIDAWAFSNNNISELNLGNGIQKIEVAAFYNNTLTNIEIPSSVTSIEERAFSNNRLTSINIPNTYMTIKGSFNNNQLSGDKAFIYGKNKDGTEDKTTIVSYGGGNKNNIVVPEGVKTVDTYAFYGTGINSISFPSTLTKIDTYAFYGNNLTSIVIPNNVTSIGTFAFYNNKLTNVTISSSVTSIGRSSFYKYSSSNSGLTQIVNKTGRSFDWGQIVNGSYSATNYNFVTGTVVNSKGNVEITN